jgi:DNA polymerase-2
VQAARKLPKPPRWVRYVITRRGPEPLRGDHVPAAIDSDHYLERQLAPAGDVVLSLLGERFADIAGRQLSLF